MINFFVQIGVAACACWHAFMNSGGITILVGIPSVILCPIVAYRRGHSAWLWAGLALFFGIFALISVFLLPKRPRPPRRPQRNDPVTLQMPLPPGFEIFFQQTIPAVIRGVSQRQASLLYPR